MPLWKRILLEKRAVVVPLVIGVVANIAAYGLWVYPLGVKSAGAADRASRLPKRAAASMTPRMSSSPRSTASATRPAPSSPPQPTW